MIFVAGRVFFFCPIWKLLVHVLWLHCYNFLFLFYSLFSRLKPLHLRSTLYDPTLVLYRLGTHVSSEVLLITLLQFFIFVILILLSPPQLCETFEAAPESSPSALSYFLMSKVASGDLWILKWQVLNLRAVLSGFGQS